MTDVFTILVQYLESIGFFKFVIPYILSFAIFYGLLRKSKIFGEKQEAIAINATIALSASFLVVAAPILAGINISTSLSMFITIFLFVLIVVLLIVFLPIVIYGKDLGSLGLKGWKMAAVLLTIVFSAILVSILLIHPIQITFSLDSESLYSVIALAIFLLIMLTILFFPSKKQ